MLYERYHLPLLITENGMSCHDAVMLDGKVHDPNRIDYVHRYLLAVRRAVEDGVPVKGYFYWSFFDNFEWARDVYKRQFLDKELKPASEIPAAERPICQHWSWDRILRSCYIKQADVLQGMYFLDHLFDHETKKRNFDFYEPMTVHESSLSPCVHSILAAELGYRDKAVEMYKRTARLDLDNINRDTVDGLHICLLYTSRCV